MAYYTQGHALLIGVGSYPNIANADVPVTVRDAQALEGVLRDGNLCGYPAEQVTLLHDQQCTREAILAALDQLASRTQAESTLFLFYAGHGQFGSDGQYYLTTHDTRLEGSRVAAGSGISDGELIERLRAIPAKRLLLIFNACHSGAIAPDLALDAPPAAFASLAPPENALEAILATGEGRIIITACRPDQKSWIGSGQLTIFTQALVDGLRGQGYVPNNGGYISAYGLYEHLYDTVKEDAEELGQPQEPELTVLRGVGPFPVALYKGASSLGTFNDQTPLRQDTALHEVKPERSQRMLQRFVQQQSNVSAQSRGVAIGGNVTGSNIITGDNNRVDQSSRTFDQRGQNVRGNQTNVAGNVNTGGGLFNAGNIHTTGDFVGRDKKTYGDVIHGDKVGGDKTTTGNVSGTGIAIGRGAQANVNQGSSAADLAQLFVPILQAVQSAAPEKREEAVTTAQALQREAAKGKQEDDSVLAGLIEDLVGLVPGAVSAVVSAFASPILAGVVGPATRYVLRKLGVK
ncbi:MAG: caspase family protein [Caldilineaceae bacterium]